MVEDSYQSTKDVFIRRNAESAARFAMSEVPAFYLVADDQCICEVDSAQFANSPRGTLARCVWTAP